MTDKFNWRLVLLLAAFGWVFAAITILGLIPGASATFRVAIGIFVFMALILALRVDHHPFRHGLVCGFLAGMVAIETQALFLTTYFANNPQYANIDMPFDWSPRLATAVLAPLNAALAAVFVATLTWILWQVHRWNRRRAENR